MAPALLLLLLAIGADRLGPGDHVRTLTVDGRERNYLIHVPPTYDREKPAPVVLIFHGAASSAAMTVGFTGLSEKSNEAGFIAVYPNGTGFPIQTFNAWGRAGRRAAGGVDDVKYTAHLLDDLATVVTVDPRRIYATGLSNGGMMSHRLAAELSDRIAAIAPVAGTLAIDIDDVKPKRAVPVMQFHGKADSIVPYDRAGRRTPRFMNLRSVPETIAAWVKANGCPDRPEVTELPDKADDGTKVVRTSYGPGRDGSEVVLVAIEGGGHTWPGRRSPIWFLGRSTLDISANDLMWEFFKKHPMPAGAAAVPAGVPDRAGRALPSTWPQEYAVRRDDAAAVLTLSTPYYTVEHDLGRGGAIAKIRYSHGRAANLLVGPIGSRLADAGGILFTDLHDSAPRVSHRRIEREYGPAEEVTVESGLMDAKGRASEVRLKTVYEYRWGYLKIHREFLFPAEPKPIKALCPVAAVLAPSLTDNGYREGTTERDGASPFSFGVCRWGKLRVDTPSDPPVKTSFVPRYLVLADPGVEGLEWFAASDLSQWDREVAGRRGQGLCLLEPQRDPPGLALSITPVNATEAAVTLSGVQTFDCYVGMSILEGHAFRPWFHTSFNRNKGNWVSAEEIRRWAEAGMQTVHCHNDGDYYNDGLFWRDGSYPPYPPADMARYDEVIEGCHRAGIRAATYFSNKELHPSTREFQENGQAWGRKDAKGNLQHNFFREKSEFGVQMCLRSGWLAFLKTSIDRVLKNHPLDGVYYDWNVALFCCNPAHEPSGAARAAGHWDIDELLELMEWTRRRVGPDGLIIVHNTATPMFATENFANRVVAMEWGYKKWSEDDPPFQGLPLEWSFAGARSRGVISYGHIDGGASRRLHRLFALEALLSGVTPWPASPETFELYPILRPLGEIESYRFADWRQTAVTLAGNRCAAAVYSRPGEAYALIANLDKAAQDVTCAVDPARFPFPLPAISAATLLGGGKESEGERTTLDAGRLAREGVTIALPPDSVRLLHLE